MNKLWFALQAFGFAREKGLMNIRAYRKAKQRLRVEIRRHDRPSKDAVEAVIAEA